MKKLSKIKLKDAVVLENREMKAIFGGSGVSGTCGYRIVYIDPAETVIKCNLSFQEVDNAIAHAWALGLEYNWCCDSCSTTSYCG
ncbi:TIGR04149 family rSAM-modified RiPP [Petrimonas sulfuriphila]|jgi:natural product precursor|uniref:TIGR04149 family rSAM-modified RiPP n=1 Tax=Petrimonas TaxID=307628 RepID=UPI002B3C705F|nr:TIGR04149 family rSAM-modified RiPP [Petrimonas sp.]